MSKPSSYHLTKIIATLGPATSNTERIEALFDAGANCFRLNFSHGTQQQHSEVYERIRATEEKKDYPVGVIADLQGPKLRLAKMPAEGCEVESGSSITLKLGDDLGSSSVCWIPHPEIFKVVNAGDRLLLDDGLICLRATKRQGETIQAQVEVGGTLKSNKGINLPGVHLPISALTERDKENLDFALDLGADWIALSFVQSPEDIIEARKLVGKRAKLIAKIEKPSAVKHIDAIIAATDGIMIARGDLGVEIDAAEVPSLQKRLIRLCRNASVPVIVATQMLESMTSNPAPTRAEASDVATAVYEGADAVMLSAETASGSYPIESVDIMRRIIVSTESDPNYRRYLLEDNETTQPAPASAIVAAAIRVADVVGASCIASFSQTGNTTLRASHLRPSCPLLGLTPLISTARMASLFWGVRSIKAKDLVSPSEMSVVVSELAKRYGFAVDGESIIITAGIPLGQPGGTNILRLSVVGADEGH